MTTVNEAPTSFRFVDRPTEMEQEDIGASQQNDTGEDTGIVISSSFRKVEGMAPDTSDLSSAAGAFVKYAHITGETLSTNFASAQPQTVILEKLIVSLYVYFIDLDGDKKSDEQIIFRQVWRQEKQGPVSKTTEVFLASENALDHYDPSGEFLGYDALVVDAVEDPDATICDSTSEIVANCDDSSIDIDDFEFIDAKQEYLDVMPQAKDIKRSVVMQDLNVRIGYLDEADIYDEETRQGEAFSYDFYWNGACYLNQLEQTS